MDGQETDDRDTLAAQKEVIRLLAGRKLALYRPYPKQYEFHALGAVHRERLMLKGNRAGGTRCFAMEAAMHLTGEYPEWWPGRMYDGPITLVTASESNESSRDIIQRELLGTPRADRKAPGFGWGALPLKAIVDVQKRQAGIPDVLETITVKHIDGGHSTIMLKSYEQGRAKIQGFAAQVFWCDEQVPDDYYSEALARTMSLADGMVALTFTALKGETSVVRRFTNPEKGDPARGLVMMSVMDAMGGVWPEGTPWAGESWEGHLTKEQVEEFLSAWPVHERETRALGRPMLGEGMVWPIGEEQIKVQPFEIPKHWRRIIGIDFGIDHPFGAASLAFDPDEDTIYVVKTWKQGGQLPPIHASVVKAMGKWIPVAWPHDGGNKEKSTGLQLIKPYIDEGLMILPRSARYQDDIGGPQKVEPIVQEVYERMVDGRFKVFANCTDFFDEMRQFHRKDGMIVAVRDDVIKAVLYGVMERRHAIPEYMMTMPRKSPALRSQGMWA